MCLRKHHSEQTTRAFCQRYLNSIVCHIHFTFHATGFTYYSKEKREDKCWSVLCTIWIVEWMVTHPCILHLLPFPNNSIVFQGGEASQPLLFQSKEAATFWWSRWPEVRPGANQGVPVKGRKEATSVLDRSGLQVSFNMWWASSVLPYRMQFS